MREDEQQEYRFLVGPLVPIDELREQLDAEEEQPLYVTPAEESD